MPTGTWSEEDRARYPKALGVQDSKVIWSIGRQHGVNTRLPIDARRLPDSGDYFFDPDTGHTPQSLISGRYPSCRHITHDEVLSVLNVNPSAVVIVFQWVGHIPKEDLDVRVKRLDRETGFVWWSGGATALVLRTHNLYRLQEYREAAAALQLGSITPLAGSP
jgi:hypothetical protein